MWIRLQAAAAPLRRWRNAVRPLVLALLLPLALGAAPGSWFLRIERFELYDGSDTGPMAVVERSIWPHRPLPVDWTASVEEIRATDHGSTEAWLVCTGHGRGAVGVTAHEHLHVPVADWIADPDCVLNPGKIYTLSAVWTFSILGVPKTVTARTEAMRLEPPALASTRR